MKFETISGSVYEVDEVNKQCRRLIGMKDPLPRQGKDGEWKPYIEMVGPRVGEPCVFFWDPETTPAFIEGGTPATMTSIVVNLVVAEA